jgi:arginine transport system substrate-binding protein
MFSYLKKFLFFILAAAGVFGMYIHSQYQIKAKSSDTITVGLQSGYPPFEFMDGSGKIVGFDLDIAALIAQKLSKSLVIKDMEFDGEILSLKQGKIDLIISGMNITPSRLKEISFVPYHGEAVTCLSLIFWKEIPPGLKSLEDLSKLGICVESGSIPEMYLNHQGIYPKSFDGALAPLMDVKFGRSSALLVEPDVAEYLQIQHPEIKTVNVPLPKEETVLGFGIGINKKNKDLFQKVQEVIQELKASGELQSLEKKWFKGGHDV